MHKTLTLVAAMGNNGGIGLDGRMPWHLPAELQHFRKTTMGKSIVMGRKTWQAIGGALPGRQNIVVSRDADFLADGAEVVTSLEAAIEISDSAEVMVIGGGQLYALALPVARRMVLTFIDIAPEADTWFPVWDEQEWRRISERIFLADDLGAPGYTIVELERVEDC